MNGAAVGAAGQLRPRTCNNHRMLILNFILILAACICGVVAWSNYPARAQYLPAGFALYMLALLLGALPAIAR